MTDDKEIPPVTGGATNVSTPTTPSKGENSIPDWVTEAEDAFHTNDETVDEEFEIEW